VALECRDLMGWPPGCRWPVERERNIPAGRGPIRRAEPIASGRKVASVCYGEAPRELGSSGYRQSTRGRDCGRSSPAMPQGCGCNRKRPRDFSRGRLVQSLNPLLRAPPRGAARQQEPQPPPRANRTMTRTHTTIMINVPHSPAIVASSSSGTIPSPDLARRPPDGVRYVQLNGERDEPPPQEDPPKEEPEPAPRARNREMPTRLDLPPQPGHASSPLSERRLYASKTFWQDSHRYS
jgi:hypothetical protein